MRLVERVTLVGDGVSLVLPVSGPGPGGWGLGSWASGALEGWWAPPAPRAESVARPQADGAFAPSRLLVGARVLTVVAHHDCVSAIEERAAREAVARLARGWVRVVVEEAGRTSHVRGFVAEQAKVQHLSGTRSTWSLVITCPDPLKYEGDGDDGDGSLDSWRVASGLWTGGTSDGGLLFNLFDQAPREDVTTGLSPALLFTGAVSTSLVVTNDGTVPTWPVLEVVGPVSWARWTLAGQVVEWSDEVPAGRLLRINAQDGMVTLGGVRISQAGLARDEFFHLPPGVSHVSVEADRVAVLRVRWLSAWT